MKRLIDVAYVNAMRKEGATVICVDKNTLLTPAAQDEINKYGIAIRDEEACLKDECPHPETLTETPACDSDRHEQETPVTLESSEEDISVALIFKVLSYLHKTGLLRRQDRLQEMLDSYVRQCNTDHD